jgi:diaminopimelate epimerase
MGELPFYKYHGTGNDFVLIEARRLGQFGWLKDSRTVGQLCDRRRGVGGDGVLVVGPARHSESVASMTVINADGSQPQMCGNGLRCVARFVHERPDTRATGASSFVIDTDAGPRHCEIQRPSDGQIWVRINMGQASFERADLPMVGSGRFIDQDLSLHPHTITGTAVSMGNPHFVCFVDHHELEETAQALGPSVERHDWFPERTNVEIARIGSPREIQLAVWERGVGLTQACGTGACATAAAAVALGASPSGESILVHLPGGTLEVLVEAGTHRVWMTGPATRVYRGALRLDDLRPASDAEDAA